MAVFMAYPLLRVFVLSLQRNNPSKPYLNGFVGLGNFIELFHTSQFYQALANSFKWVILEVVLQLLFGMAIALLLNKKI